MIICEHREKTAVLALENVFDPSEPALGEGGCKYAVSSAERVVHSLHHRFELRRHQTGCLRAGDADCVLEPSGVEAPKLRSGDRRGEPAIDGSRVPAVPEHRVTAHGYT